MADQSATPDAHAPASSDEAPAATLEKPPRGLRLRPPDSPELATEQVGKIFGR